MHCRFGVEAMSEHNVMQRCSMALCRNSCWWLDVVICFTHSSSTCLPLGSGTYSTWHSHSIFHSLSVCLPLRSGKYSPEQIPIWGPGWQSTHQQTNDPGKSQRLQHQWHDHTSVQTYKTALHRHSYRWHDETKYYHFLLIKAFCYHFFLSSIFCGIIFFW